MTADARQEVIDAFIPHTPWNDSSPSVLLPQPELARISQLRSIDRDNVAEFPAVGGLIDDLLCRRTVERIETMLSQSLDGGFLRVELARNVGEFWGTLSPETDGSLMAMLICVDASVATKSSSLGVSDADQSRAATAFWRDNLGRLFTPTNETWPDQPLPVDAERRWVLISCVTQTTDWKLPPRRIVRVA